VLLPERTVDIWAALAIEKLAPGTYFWAPTTNAQAKKEPFDLKAKLGWKVLLLEHKGIDDQRCIAIGTKQLGTMIGLEKAVGSNAVFYGLPFYGSAGFSMAWQNNFAAKQRMFTPSDLLNRIVSAAIPRRGQAKPYYKLQPSFFKSNSGKSLAKTVKDARACRLGFKVDSESRAALLKKKITESIEALPPMEALHEITGYDEEGKPLVPWEDLLEEGSGATRLPNISALPLPKRQLKS
jgi:hypothetical protein